jgi:xanthine dehydrogenase large subunit
MLVNDSELHAQGASIFTDDIPLMQGTLHAFPVVSTIAHGRILAVDTSAAMTYPGVVKI